MALVSVRKRYEAEVQDLGLVIWRLPAAGLGGVRAGIDEVTWRDVDVESFDTSFCLPAKGPGHVQLVARLHNGRPLGMVASNRYESTIYKWHLAVSGLIEQAYPGCTRIRDDGYDA